MNRTFTLRIPCTFKEDGQPVTPAPVDIVLTMRGCSTPEDALNKVAAWLQQAQNGGFYGPHVTIDTEPPGRGE
jgi:hypothetical protein